MRSKLLSGVAAATLAAGVILLSGGGASAGWFYPHWFSPTEAGVNPDIISGPLLSSSSHWLSISDYYHYRSTFPDPTPVTRPRHRH